MLNAKSSGSGIEAFFRFSFIFLTLLKIVSSNLSSRVLYCGHFDGLQERGEKCNMLWVLIPKWEFRVAKPAGKPQGSGACVGLKGSVVCITILSTQTQCCKLGPKISEPTSI